MKNLVFIFLLFIPSVLFARIGWNHNGVLAYGGLQSQAHSPIVGLRLEIDHGSCVKRPPLAYAIGLQSNLNQSFLLFGRFTFQRLGLIIPIIGTTKPFMQIGIEKNLSKPEAFQPAIGFTNTMVLTKTFYLKSAIYCSSNLVYKTKYNFTSASSLNLELGLGVPFRALRIKKKKPN